MLPAKSLLFNHSMRFLPPIFLSILCQIRSFKTPSYSILADQCTSMKNLKQIHGQMIVTSRILDNYAASRIISFCALSNFGDLDYALKLFENITEPNSFMWNTIIRGFADSSEPYNAIFFYINMKKLGFPPGKHTFPFLLKACGNTGSRHLCKQVHRHVLFYGFDSDDYVLNGLIRCYSCSGDVYDARKVFDAIHERNLVIWTTMITGYAQNSYSKESLMLFDQMINAALEPNSATLSSVLSACAKEGALDLGKRIHVYIQEKGIEIGVILGTALIDMYLKNGVIYTAKKMFDEMLEKNTATWNVMIGGMAVHGYVEDALKLFHEMENENVRPNDVTFVGVLSACSHSGFFEIGQQIFHSMGDKYGIYPKLEHYGCMVDILGRSGRLNEAEKLIKEMEWKPDVAILGALLTSCKTHGKLEVAERTARKILELEPHNHGVYVMLSNIYAEAGEWKNVTKLRKIMRSSGLKKIPGWSLIDGEK